MRWLRILTLLILMALLLCLAPPQVEAAEAWLPTTIYEGAPIPDFGNVSFSNLPVLQEAGAISIPEDITGELGWNPSRAWEAGTPLANVMQLGDVSETFGLEAFNLNAIAQSAGLDLSKLSLSNLQLMNQQTIASLVKAIPSLGELPLGQVKPLLDLVNLKLPTSMNLGLARQPLSAIATDDLLGSLSLNELNLDQFSFTSIPGLDQTALVNLKDWQGSAIAGIPGLDKIPFAQFPINPFQIFGMVAIHDVTYGGDQAHKESRQKPTKFSITGSDKVGFNYNCAQAKGCDYIELNAPGYSGFGGMSAPGGLHGAKWIRGGKDDGEQMVPGGKGILGQLNNGMEPTGRLSFGKAFKVVLIDTDESTGTGRFGLYFRVCIKKAFIDLGCTPYFIGPIPWLSTKEKGLVFVGLADGAGGMDELPPGNQLPPEVQDQINQITGEYAGEDSTDDSSLCGSGAGGVDFRALADAISSIEGGYTSAGQWGCDGGGNCGRGLGRYQFMTYREDAKAAILKKPGGADFIRRANAPNNSLEYLRSLERELPRYFSPSDQDAVFKGAMTRDINYYRSVGKQGTELIACLGENWYSGGCSHSTGRDYTGGPTIREYGQRTVDAYQGALKRYGSKPCSGNGQPGVVTGRMSYPVGANAPIGGQYGEDRGDHAHAGVDFSMPVGTPIKSADGGTVVDACIGCDPNGYGALIIVRHTNGLETWYAHVNTINVKIGDKVSKGQVIGTVGNRGRSSGPHLHFEVRQNGRPVNPMPYLNKN
jgi:murein DD-endopeptidase MepM/ murein hydrolase activator NlpD